ncbi:ABC transporter ATP-binding protein [Piscinibacter terrae]|uniref:ABC transporter ATP-binding protein n=1 Tax=Piscinibacter terrae TaxID=2496871 RepID=A0A3N7K0V5_9BURK|nr:ABC transporter ATP-binding protein [Albitalea terrae]RQP24635.1 ABC transporter ATP-binding protein [Albitalea terrae]
MVDLEFCGVTKLFPDGTCAIRDISFTAPGGQLTTLLGPSGSGKSTLLRIAAGLEAATHGAVYLDGRDVSTLHGRDRDVSMLFQGDSLFPHLDVIGNVAFGLQHSGFARDEARERARRALDLVGLQGSASDSCAELSGGQQQRVALARALALEPSVVLLDEPLSNLDDRLRRQMRGEIRSLQRRLGLTVVYVTHDESEAMAVSDRVVIINEGHLLQVGTPREVYERPNSEFVATFIGDASIFDLTVAADGVPHLGSLPVGRLAQAYPPGTRLRVVIRPEAWQILPVGLVHGMAARVRRCSYLGHGAEYLLDTELGQLLASSRHVNALHQPGAPVNLTLGMHGISVLNSSQPAYVHSGGGGDDTDWVEVGSPMPPVTRTAQ